MNRALNVIIKILLSKNIIGHKHTPEAKFIKKETRWLKREERKSFEKEYKQIINLGLVIRQKKRTKKGQDWHISLNPRKLKEINEMIQ